MTAETETGHPGLNSSWNMMMNIAGRIQVWIRTQDTLTACHKYCCTNKINT
jgi:hypothetical protein